MKSLDPSKYNKTPTKDTY